MLSMIVRGHEGTYVAQITLLLMKKKKRNVKHFLQRNSEQYQYSNGYNQPLRSK